MSSSYNRPEGGWRLKFAGVKTNAPADSMPPDKYPYAENVRSVGPYTIQTRPGQSFICSTAAYPITDIRAYTQLDTDDLPRFLLRNSNNDIYLDTGGSIVYSLAGASQGACMIPYRPSNSPQPWMYIAVQEDYQKISPPNQVAPIIDHIFKVGIEEQHESPQTCNDQYSYYQFTADATFWTHSGTAGALFTVDHWSATNHAGTAVLPDPASGPRVRYSVQVDPAYDYEIGLYVVFDTGGSPPYPTVIEDVFPAVNGGGTLTVQSITYYAGTSGRCVITPSAMPIGDTVVITDNIPAGTSVFVNQILSTLRRGSLVRLNGTETCYILSVTTGPNGQICFEVATSGTFVAGNTIVGITAIGVCDVDPSIAGKTLRSTAIDSLISTGVATFSQNFVTNPFNQLMIPVGRTPQQSDYFSINLFLNTVLDTAEITINFRLSTSGDALYYTTTPNDLLGTASLSDTALHVPIRFALSDLTRAGNNNALTLANCVGVDIIVTTTAAVGFQFGSLMIGGGGQPDVGEVGSPYFYSVVGRSSITGATSNPSPITRYGVSPRRQQVIVSMTDTISDSQLDTWDVYRYGGSLTSFRFIGSMPRTSGPDYFTDDYFDAAASAGSVIEYDNFQPWPTIGLPFNPTAGTDLAGMTTYLAVNGTSVFVVYYSGMAFTNPAPDTILRWLPGTLMTIGGQSAYTLRNRPVSITLSAPPTAFYYAYRFDLVENAGSDLSLDHISILEPNVANQHLPYLWGPDAAGTVFAVGDPLRAGTLYYAKSNNPDSAPDSYNREITAPSEPLLGGEVINGIALVASSNRWWALYPQFDEATRYQVVEKPVGRGLAAPYGHCTDGRTIYFWAKDGIWSTEAKSLTDADLYNIFPHEGIAGSDYTYGGKTIYAPDYSRAGTFRLAYVNGYLYAGYQDSTGTARTLVCDLTDPANPAWRPDVYSPSLSAYYTVEQQAGTLLTSTDAYAMLVMGDSIGNVFQQAKNANDNGQPIPCSIFTFEYNGGDLRSDQLFNDAFVDLLPTKDVTVQPISDGTPVGTPGVFGPSASRISSNVPIGLELKYMGVKFSWTDNFDTQSVPTVLYAWQPMYEGVPISVFLWKNQSTAFGLNGYFHIRQINFAYRATADVTLTITMQDGTSPSPIVLPSTSGVYKKVMFPCTYNKGLSVLFSATSAQEWTPYLSDTEIYIGDWGREDSYKIAHDIDAPRGIKS